MQNSKLRDVTIGEALVMVALAVGVALTLGAVGPYLMGWR